MYMHRFIYTHVRERERERACVCVCVGVCVAFTSSSGCKLEDLSRFAISVQIVARDPGHVDAGGGQVLNHEGAGVDILGVGHRVGLHLLLGPVLVLVVEVIKLFYLRH